MPDLHDRKAFMRPATGVLGNKTDPHRASKTWTEEELQILRDNPHMSTHALKARLPNRSAQSIGNKRKHYSVDPVKCEGTPVNPEEPIGKEPGEYIETLSAYFVDYEDCLNIWLKWNGYITCKELCRDWKVGAFGIVTLLCQAK